MGAPFAAVGPTGGPFCCCFAAATAAAVAGAASLFLSCLYLYFNC